MRASERVLGSILRACEFDMRNEHDHNSFIIYVYVSNGVPSLTVSPDGQIATTQVCIISYGIR